MLGLATKAGKVIFGCNLTVAAIRRDSKSKKPKIVVIACDASDNTKKRIINCCTYYGVEYYTTDLTGNELSKATGRRGLIACVGIIDINFSEAIKNILNEQTKP